MDTSFNTHFTAVERSKIKLSKNSAYHKMGGKAVINIEWNKHKHSDNDEMRHSKSIINDLPFVIMM